MPSRSPCREALEGRRRVILGLLSGQLLSIAQNTALFSLIGTLYGGNGMTSFALSSLQSRSPNNMTYTICTEGVFPPELTHRSTTCAR
jgi:Phage Tail Collar Domain